MELKNFIGIHSGDRILVLGNGKSILNLPKDTIIPSIGVNDIDRYVSPTYLVLTDSPDRFGLPGTRRRLNVEKTKAKFAFVSDKSWTFKSNRDELQMYKRIVYTLGNRGGLTHIDSDSIIDFSICSPYVAICLAIKMGATEIGVLGVDFTDGHFYSPNDGEHSIVKAGLLPQFEKHLEALVKLANERNINIWNLSDASIIKALPRKKLQDFLC